MPESIPAQGPATAAAVLPLLRLAMEENHAQLAGQPRSRDADAVWLVAEDLLSRELPEESLEVARLGAVLGLHYALFREFRDALTPEFREKFRRRVRLAVESMGRAFHAMRSPIQSGLPDPVPGVVESIILREISRHVQQHASVRGLPEIMHWSTALLLEALARPAAARAEEIGPGSWMQALAVKAPVRLRPGANTQPLIISGDQLIEELQSLAARERAEENAASIAAAENVSEVSVATDQVVPEGRMPAGTGTPRPQDEWELPPPGPEPAEPQRRASRPSLRSIIGGGHPEFIAEMPAAQGRDSFQTGPVSIDLPEEAHGEEQPRHRRRRKKTSRRGRMKVVLLFIVLFASTFFVLNKAYHKLPQLRELIQGLRK